MALTTCSTYSIMSFKNCTGEEKIFLSNNTRADQKGHVRHNGHDISICDLFFTKTTINKPKVLFSQRIKMTTLSQVRRQRHFYTNMIPLSFSIVDFLLVDEFPLTPPLIISFIYLVSLTGCSRVFFGIVACNSGISFIYCWYCADVFTWTLRKFTTWLFCYIV